MYKSGVLVLLLLSFMFVTCKQISKEDSSLMKEIDLWKNYKIGERLEVPFPKIPVVKNTNYSSSVLFEESYVEHKFHTFSVNRIYNKDLKDRNAWEKFMQNEVLAFKAVEQKEFLLWNQKGIISKVQEGALCGYSFNMIVENDYILNVVLRSVKGCPSEDVFLHFLSKLKNNKK